jgi:hypothetical protein
MLLVALYRGITTHLSRELVPLCLNLACTSVLPQQRISAEQLRSLLEEAEQCQRSHPRPPISKAKLAALLKDPYTTSFSHSGPFPADD